MAGERYTQEFRVAAVKQITQEEHPIPAVARRLRINTKSFYNWPTRWGDNACAETFFSLLKKERIRRRTYPTREGAKADVFNYIGLFYNPKQCHGNHGDLSPMEFKNNYLRNQAGV